MTEFETHEVKANADIHQLFENYMREHESYREANDQRLKEIERKAVADTLTTEKVERISEVMDRTQAQLRELSLKQQRPQLDGHSKLPSEHKTAFENYVRRGEVQGLLRLEEKALSVGTNADGGYTVPLEIEQDISRRLAKISPIRSLATVQQVSGATYRKPFATNGFSVGWVAETAARPQTNTPTLDALDFPTAELYAMPAASPSLLDDSAVNIEEWVASQVEISFAEQEGTAFVTGDGTNKPKGFLSYTNVADASWAHGNIGYVASGAAANFATTNPSDKLMDLVYALRAGYRQNGTFVMNRKTQAEIRKFKATDGQYLWSPPAQPGGQAMLMGFPVVESEDMPDVAANAFPIAFGDFKRGYLVVDRAGIKILRDPYSAKPYVLFYTVKRVGGGVQDFEAIKLFKIATA